MTVAKTTYLSRSRIGALTDASACAHGVAERFDAMKYPDSVKMMVVVDADAWCYASARSSTIDRMLESGELALIGTYTNKCKLSDIADDVREMAKEYGEKA